MECANSSSAIHDEPVTEEEIIQHLIRNKDVYFKSQQIGEEDLSLNEKEQLAKTILQQNKSTFLARFGKNLKPDHMRYFKRSVEENAEDFLLNYHYNTLLRYHTKSVHDIEVRNRRYEALKHLIAEDAYFSEKEMMKRNPLLYDQMVGKYLSDEERKLRDGRNVDKANVTSFVHLLMEGIERDIAEDVKKEQKKIEMDEDSNSGGSERSGSKSSAKDGPFSRIKWNKLADKANAAEIVEEDTDDDEEEETPKIVEIPPENEPKPMEVSEEISMDTELPIVSIPAERKLVAFRISPKKLDKSAQLQKKPVPVINGHASHRLKANKTKSNHKLAEKCKQWGEYETMKDIRPWKRKEVASKPEDITISIQERHILREEFLSLMYQSFLDGKDDFDYSTFDFNEEYDNTEILEHDEEEKYFESESPNEEDASQEKNSMECSSEDELDVFMERLNQHPTICQLSQDLKNL